ncbi:MAG: ATP-binding protein [Planctomycetes bacterium]|nr:ATP-binding protein [Planctomycetota bacterium]
MLEKYRLDEITKETLELLVSESAAESRTLDFKSELPGSKDTDRRAFAADAAAFANSGGGSVVYGVTERGGMATEVCGLLVEDVDKEILRLQEILRRGVDPRINGVEFVPVRGFRLGPAIVMRVPRSWNAPHMVTAGGAESRFYVRSGAQNAPLDVHQIRAAFLGSHEASDRVRRFRDERLGRIVGDETPVRLVSQKRVALHLVPLASLDPGSLVDLTGEASSVTAKLRPIGASGWNDRYNLDGFVTFDEIDRAEGRSIGYVQLFRRGMIEAVDSFVSSDFLRGRAVADEEEVVVPGGAFPRDIVEAVWIYMEALKKLAVAPPIVALLSLMGVRGMHVYMSPRYMIRRVARFDRETMLLPDVLFEEYPQTPEQILAKLTPAFDALWQASGYPRFVDLNE